MAAKSEKVKQSDQNVDAVCLVDAKHARVGAVVADAVEHDGEQALDDTRVALRALHRKRLTRVRDAVRKQKSILALQQIGNQGQCCRLEDFVLARLLAIEHAAEGEPRQLAVRLAPRQLDGG